MLPQDSFRKHAVTNAPANSRTRAVLASLSSCAMVAFPALKGEAGSAFALHDFGTCSECSFALRPARSLTPFKGALSFGRSGRLVASSPAMISTGWSDICRVGFLPTLPLESCAFLTAHFNSLLGNYSVSSPDPSPDPFSFLPHSSCRLGIYQLRLSLLVRTPTRYSLI